MNQLFLGNSRILLFKPGSSSAPTPVARSTTIITTQENGELPPFSINGTLDNDWFVTNGFYDYYSGEWSKHITDIDIGTGSQENPLTSIGNNAFEGCNQLTNIIFPNTLKTIENNAFAWSVCIENIELPESLSSIGEYVFQGCSNLQNIYIPNSVISIGKYAFSDCSKLDNVTLPNNLDVINDNMFDSCESLTNLTIPATVHNIGNNIVNNTPLLKNITIPCVAPINIGSFNYDGSVQSNLCIKFPNIEKSYIESLDYYSWGLGVGWKIICSNNDTIEDIE